eukprot:m.1613183 g.1613183  ORF g.1613183 m.1613183 type:complete len:210 (+) comp25368_c0_seq83:178-807(+)
MYATTIVALVEDNCERKFFSARCDRMSLDLVSLVCKLFGTQATLYLTDSFTKNIIERGNSSSDKATVTSAAKAQKNIEAIQPVQGEGEAKLGGWAPAKGKAKQIASMLHQSTEQEASKIQELSSKHESTKNKAISHEEKRLKQHKDHYRNPTPSQDALCACIQCVITETIASTTCSKISVTLTTYFVPLLSSTFQRPQSFTSSCITAPS